jgi:L-threonylcarbamoyladenylate synthase
MAIQPVTAASVASAARYLAQGGLVAFPTETVYGLGADATNGLAVAGIFSVKGRPTFNPLIIHLPTAELAWRYGVSTPLAAKLAAALWPGPLTLVLPLKPGADVEPLALAGLSTIAIRVPSHPVAQALLRQAGRPIAAPSANRSGRISPTSAAHVHADFGDDLDIILDGGDTDVGLESTIVDVSGPAPVLLRPGGITRAALEAVLGMPVSDVPVDAADAAMPNAPGQLASHYAPRAAVRLDASDVADGEALLAFGTPLPHGGAMRNLSPAGDLLEAAAHLFAALRSLDATGARTIAVMPIPQRDLGEAINDRLRRAAAPR